MILRFFSVIVILLLSIIAYANWPMSPIADGMAVDSVVVYKSKRLMELHRNGKMVKQYAISLGGNPIGHKSQEGDQRTPEGTYIIDYHKIDSAFHYALHINYPNKDDVEAAKKLGVSPGGLIMIHGVRNGLGYIGRLHQSVDWTNGCIAVTNAEIEEIARVVPAGTPITIHP